MHLARAHGLAPTAGWGPIKPEMGPLTDGGFSVDRRCSPCDRRKGEEMNGAIVCGVDGSPDSQRAIAVAAELARRLGANLILANVVTHVADPLVPGGA